MIIKGNRTMLTLFGIQTAAIEVVSFGSFSGNGRLLYEERNDGLRHANSPR